MKANPAIIIATSPILIIPRITVEAKNSFIFNGVTKRLRRFLSRLLQEKQWRQPFAIGLISPRKLLLQARKLLHWILQFAIFPDRGWEIPREEAPSLASKLNPLFLESFFDKGKDASSIMPVSYASAFWYSFMAFNREGRILVPESSLICPWLCSIIKRAFNFCLISSALAKGT